MGVNTVSITEFARKLKQKYPKYAAAADDKLVIAFCKKFPQYKVNYEGATPVSVSVISTAAAPASTATKTAPIAPDVPSGGLNESSEPSPAPSVARDMTSDTPGKVPEASVASSASAPVTPPQVEPEPPASDTAQSPAIPATPNVESTPKAEHEAAAPQTTSQTSSAEARTIPESAQEESTKKAPRIGAILFGVLIIAALTAFGAYRFGLIPRKFLRPAPKEQVEVPAVNEDRSGSGGEIGEYISGRTTYSDEFVNVESIRIRRSGEGSILTATVYNKSQSRLNTVIINVSCYSGDGKQVVNALFTIRNLPPGDRAVQEMTGVLNGVPSRVDIVRVTNY